MDYKDLFITNYKNLINFTMFVNKLKLLKPIYKNLKNKNCTNDENKGKFRNKPLN